MPTNVQNNKRSIQVNQVVPKISKYAHAPSLTDNHLQIKEFPMTYEQALDEFRSIIDNADEHNRQVLLDTPPAGPCHDMASLKDILEAAIETGTLIDSSKIETKLLYHEVSRYVP
jgi:DNA transposition AAA+ family ATPase